MKDYIKTEREILDYTKTELQNILGHIQFDSDGKCVKYFAGQLDTMVTKLIADIVRDMRAVDNLNAFARQVADDKKYFHND